MRETTTGSFKYSFLIQLFNQIFGFVITVILARLLTPADFGTVAILLIFVGLAKIITEGGLAASLIRTKDATELDYTTVFYLNLAGSLFFYFLLYFLAKPISLYFELPEVENLLQVNALILIIGAFTITQSVKLNKEMQFKTQLKLLVPSLIISGAIGVGMAVMGYGVWSLVIKDLSFAFIASLQLWFYSKWLPKRAFSWTCVKYHLSFGVNLVLTNLISKLFAESYKFVIGKYFSTHQLGLFSRAKSMEELPNQIVFNSINRVLFPLLAQRQHDSVLLRQTYGNVIRTITCIVTPFLAFLLFVAEPLFEVLLTKKWVEAVPYFKILLIAGMLSPIQPYLLNICKVKSRSDLVLKLSIVEYFFIFLSILGIFFFGMYGLLWGLVFATAAKVISAMYFAGRLIDYSMFDQFRDLSEGFLLAIIGLVVVFPLSYFSIISITNNYFYIVVYGLIFYTAVVSIAVLFNFKIISEIKALLKRRFK